MTNTAISMIVLRKMVDTLTYTFYIVFNWGIRLKINVRHGSAMKVGDWDVSIRSLISVRWKNRVPRLVLHEKFEKLAKWTARGITTAAILSSVIAFPTWYFSLSFAVLMFLVEQFVERCIFEYTSIYVQPMPDFALKMEEWKGMAFAFPQQPDPKLLNVVGCAFATKDYAHKFFELLRDWNYQKKEDRDNNICLSFILDDTHYIAYLYPNPDRHTVREFFDAAEDVQKLEKHGKTHQRLAMQMVLGKRFPYGDDAKLKLFVRNQPANRPFWLKPFLMHDDGTLEMLYDEEPILKHDFKFKSKKDLTPQEYEYHLLRNQAKR